MQDNLLGGFVGSKLSRINGDVCIGRFFVRIGNAGELLNDTRARFGVETFPVPTFANFNRSGKMHHDKSTQRRDHRAYFFSRRIVRGNWSADRDPTIFRNLRSDISDATDVEIAMFARKTKLGRQMLAHKIAVKKRNWPAANLEELDDEDIRDGRFARAGETGEKDSETLLIARWKTSAQFLDYFSVSKPVR